jgi:ubiquinone/menaquinone biosynthesis C-methylase UbiE
MREAVLEPLLRRMRIGRVLPYIRKYPGCELLDIGCGWDARFLRSVEPFIGHGEGIDFKAPTLQTEKLSIRPMTVVNQLPFADNSFDVVTMLAVLEHLAEPDATLRDIYRVLRPAGRLVLTVPSDSAKPVLEFLAYRLHVVSEAEIRDHKQYFNKTTLSAAVGAAGFEVEEHRYFQLGFNNFLVARKSSSAGRNSALT